MSTYTLSKTCVEIKDQYGISRTSVGLQISYSPAGTDSGYESDSPIVFDNPKHKITCTTDRVLIPGGVDNAVRRLLKADHLVSAIVVLRLAVPALSLHTAKTLVEWIRDN